MESSNIFFCVFPLSMEGEATTKAQSQAARQRCAKISGPVMLAGRMESVQSSLIRFCLWQRGENGAETPSSHATHAFAKGAKTVVIAGRNGDVKSKSARDRKREVRNIACSIQCVSAADAHSEL